MDADKQLASQLEDVQLGEYMHPGQYYQTQPGMYQQQGQQQQQQQPQQGSFSAAMPMPHENAQGRGTSDGRSFSPRARQHMQLLGPAMQAPQSGATQQVRPGTSGNAGFQQHHQEYFMTVDPQGGGLWQPGGSETGGVDHGGTPGGGPKEGLTSKGRRPLANSTSNRLKMVLEMLLPCNVVCLFPDNHQEPLRAVISSPLLCALANLAGFYCMQACAACESRFDGTFMERVASKMVHYKSEQHFDNVKNFLAHNQSKIIRQMSPLEVLIRNKASEVAQHVEKLVQVSASMVAIEADDASAPDGADSTAAAASAGEGEGKAAQLASAQKVFKQYVDLYKTSVMDMVQLLDVADSPGGVQQGVGKAQGSPPRTRTKNNPARRQAGGQAPHGDPHAWARQQSGQVPGRGQYMTPGPGPGMTLVPVDQLQGAYQEQPTELYMYQPAAPAAPTVMYQEHGGPSLEMDKHGGQAMYSYVPAQPGQQLVLQQLPGAGPQQQMVMVIPPQQQQAGPGQQQQQGMMMMMPQQGGAQVQGRPQRKRDGPPGRGAPGQQGSSMYVPGGQYGPPGLQY